MLSENLPHTLLVAAVNELNDLNQSLDCEPVHFEALGCMYQFFLIESMNEIDDRYTIWGLDVIDGEEVSMPASREAVEEIFVKLEKVVKEARDRESADAEPAEVE